MVDDADVYLIKNNVHHKTSRELQNLFGMKRTPWFHGNSQVLLNTSI